jgi:hypothetical protein
MSPPKSSYPTTANPDYSDTTEVKTKQNKNLKTNIMKRMEVLKKENKSLKEKGNHQRNKIEDQRKFLPSRQPRKKTFEAN